jgi:hypothetical protein
VGADIHAFIEYETERGGPFEFSRGQLALPAEYVLFHALAGVRPQTNDPPLVPPRGLPARVSDEVLRAYFTPVFADEDVAARPPPRGVPFYLLQSEVEATLEYQRGERRGEPGDRHWLVADPDWHTPSWLTYREVLAALAHLGLTVAERSPEFRATLAAMAELATAYGPDRVWLVFWFDN